MLTTRRPWHLLALLVALGGCPPPSPGTDGGVDASTGVDSSPGVDSSTGADGGTDGGPSGPLITECPGANRPPLPSGTCEVTPGSGGQLYTGTVLLPGRVLRGGQVLVSPNGTIACVSCDCTQDAGAANATQISCPTGVISPGLINTHDHITFTQNAPGPDSGERYEQRHDWRIPKRGHTKITVPGGANGDQLRWGELRFIFSGATSTVGSGSISGLLRNLDGTTTQEGLGQKTVNFETFPLGDTSGVQLTGNCGYSYRDTAQSIAGEDAYLPHIAEGIDDVSRNEFLCASSSANGGQDLVQSQSAFIHSIALRPSDYGLMATDGTALIWSPRSNIRLYGDTAQVPVAQRLGVLIALGTDWTASGSMNMLRELRCADEFNRTYYNRFFTDEQLWLMATYNAAQATATDDVIGQLKAGLVADIAIFDDRDRNGAQRIDYRAVLAADPEDVVLVLRGGKVLYGDAGIVSQLPGAGTCDAVDVCGTPKSACLGEVARTYAQLETANASTYPAFFCDTPTNEPTCVPSRPAAVNGSTVYTGQASASDSDGDGIPDAQDNCPRVFNPVRPLDNGAQADFDSDGAGDPCDVCPLDANSTSCRPVDPNDPDNDGHPTPQDNCPMVSNPDQADGDNDGKGDVCDPCPQDANPGSQACPGSIYAVKRGTITSTVALRNALVTARNATGYFLQVKETDPGYQGPAYSGLYVFAQGNTVQAGDRVDIPNATINVFNGQIQLNNPAATVVTRQSETPPQPVTESAPGVPLTAADITTGGPLAEAFEGVLVQLRNVTVTDVNPPSAGGDSSPNNEFIVDNSLRVNDFLYLTSPFPLVGETFLQLTGVLNLRNANSKVEPRNAADLVPARGRLVAFGPSGFVRLGPGQLTVPMPLTVTLARPVDVETVVAITSSDEASLQVPGGSITVPPGAVSATVLLDAFRLSSGVTLTATLDGISLTSQIRVIDGTERPALIDLQPATAVIPAGGARDLTVMLDLPAPAGGITINLTTTGGTVPATVTVMPNQTRATFAYTQGGPNPSDTVTATYNGVSRTATISVGASHLVINEIDYDQPINPDSAEFIEIHNPTPQPVDLTNLIVVLVNGSNSTEYTRISLSGTLAAGGYLVIASPGLAVDPGATVLRFSGATDQIQNGSPDAVLLFDTTNNTVVDALSYEGSITAANITGVTGTFNLVEGTPVARTKDDPGTGTGNASLIRQPNGADSDNADADWQLTRTVTPGAANVYTP